jgi:translocation and assembly module TamB
MNTARKSVLMTLGLVAAIALVVVAGRLVLATKGAQTYITERVLNLINGPGQIVTVTATDGDWPGNIILSGITVSDSQGVWLSVDRVTLDWHPARVLRGRIDIESAAAGTAAMTRVPEGAPSASAGAPFNVDSLVAGLTRVQVRRMTVDSLSLAPGVMGEAITATAAGSLLGEGGGKALNLELTRTDQPGHARVTARADARLIGLTLDAAAEGFTADADVSIAKPSDALAGTINVSRAPPGASGQAAVTLGGTRRDPTVAATFDVRDLITEGRPVARVSGAVRAARAPGGEYILSGEGTVSGVRATLPELAAVASDEARWTLKATQTDLTAVTLDLFEIVAGDTSLAVTGTMADDEIRPASVTLRIRGLGRVAGAADTASMTTAELTAERFTTAGVGNGLLRATASNLPNDLPALNLSARWEADENALRIASISGLSAGVKLTGTSTWPRQGSAIDHGTSRLSLTAQAAALGFAEGDPISVTADLAGTLASLKAQIQASTARLGAPDQAFTDLVATLTGERTGEGFDAAVDARATWLGAPATLTARAATSAPGEIAIGLQADSVAGHMAGDLKVAAASSLAAGVLSARLDDIAPLARVFNIDAAGALNAELSFAPRGAAQQVEGTMTVNNLATHPFSTSRMTVTAQVEDAWRARQFDVNVRAAKGQLVGRPITSLTGHAAGTAAAYDVSLNAAAGDGAPPLLAVRAHVLDTGTAAITFSQLALNDGALSASLTGPAIVSISPETISVDSVTANVGEGTLTGNVSLARREGSITASFTAKGITAGDVAPAGYRLPAGTLDGQIDISGPINDAAASVRIAATFAADRINATPAFTLAADAEVSGGRLVAAATVTGLSSAPATLSGELPLRLDLSAFQARVDMDAPLSVLAAWNGNIAPLWALLPLDEHLLSGNADLNITVTGTPGAPRAAGSVTVTGGRYENIPAGLVLRDITLKAATERGDDLAVTLSAGDTGRGTLTVTGRLDRNAGGQWTADLGGELNRLRVLARDDVTALTSGKITYRGPLLAGLLKGDLAVGDATIHLDSTGVPEVPLLRSFAAVKADTFAADASVPEEAPITLDVSLSMGEPLTVEGRGLESAWRGDLYVKGSISAPDVVGGLALERGTFSFLGQTFELESGTVTFTGGGHIDPQLNVVAVREVTDITVTVNINGLATAPTITLSSRPALPQDEVLARLLFNRNMGELGPLESIQLASAAADMSGLARGGISGVVKRTLGLDTFGFGGQSGSAVVVGRQISRNIFVSVEQNVDNTSRVFTITWRLTRHFSLRSSANDQTGADFGVFWRKDY